MAQVVRAGIGAGADAALFPGANSIITSLFDLARELYASREMCEDLIKSVSDLEGPIKAMLARGNVSITEHAIKLYEKLLIDMRDYLRDHLRGSKATRLAKHWDMKDRVKQFYAERDTIVAVLNVEFIDESTSNQVEIKTLIKEVADRNERIEKQHQQGLETLERLIKEIVLTTAAQIEDAVAKAALADLKNEIKNNSAAYSDSELKIMKQVFLTGCDSSNIPRDKLSLPHWYISRSDVHRGGGNLFASGQNHNLHYGVLKDSGASVVVNLVNAGPGDERSRERFVKEVGIASLLHDPHVLPFYGANHVGSPLMYVTAHAKGGDFRSYLKANPHRFWQLFLDAARGVAYLHKHKVVHANLKCSNLLVMGDGTGVVSDFMFAFVRASSVLSLKTQPPTYDWTAPECLELDANPRFESDIYSLGMCLVEAVTGKRPYEDQTDNDDQTRAMIHAGKLPNWAVYDKIPGEVTELVEKMCATDYNARPSLRQVIEIFEALAAKEKITYEMLSSTPDNE